jgi:hypothetical protein
MGSRNQNGASQFGKDAVVRKKFGRLTMRDRLKGCLLAALLCVSGFGVAQNTNSGDIRGTVTDATGAVIPGVTVVVKDVDKGDEHTFTTDAAGLYDTGPIVADHYLLTFTKEGFQTYIRGPITLQVGTDTVNAQLAVGASTEQVVVKTDLPLLETEAGSQEATLSSHTMAELPQVGADWQNFVILLPGAAGTPENSTAALPTGQVASINGNLPYASTLADGATTTLPMSQNADVTIFETTAEVKVSTAAFSAQYGVGDIVFNQITKSGSDKFHGTGYEYFQNDALNARSFFDAPNQAIPVLRYNNFGFNVSGPVIPRRMFFFFDYDKTINNGGASTGFLTTPSAAMMSGDFSAPGLPTLYDPTTQVWQMTGTHTYPGGQTVTCPCVIRKSFAEEFGNGNKIPSGMLSPVAQQIQKVYPTANVAGTVSSGFAQNNYRYNTPSTNPFTKFFGRLDWDITPKNRLTMSETESDNPATYLNQGLCPINCQNGDVSRDNAQITDVWSFSSTFINEARIGFTDQLNFFTPFTINQGYPGKLGWQFAKADNFPNMTISSFWGPGSSSNAVYKEFVIDPSDVVMLIRGRHVLHFGGEFLINRADSTAWGNLDAGSMTYDGSFTTAGGKPTQATDGFSYADFLLGQTQAWSAQVTPEYGGRWKSPQLFVQDDYKLRPNLTLNLGLRWEGNTGWSEVKGNMTVFDPTVTNPADGSKGAMWYGFSKANGRDTLQKPLYNIWLPRVGFAYAPNPVTTIRGGFGVYASSWSEDTYGGGMGNAFGSSGNYNDTTNGFCPVVSLDSDGSAPDTSNPGCGISGYNSTSLNSRYLTSPSTADARNGSSVTYNQYHTPVPTNYQWTLDVQREFATDFVADIAYVGNHGKNLYFNVDINQVPEANLGPNDLGSKPYQLFDQINGSTNNAVSNYHALQAQLTKRMTYGLQFNVNYSWSHFLDDQDSSGWGSRGGWTNYQDAYHPHANYSNSNFDIRNMFKGQVIYQLPFGRGRMFLNNNTLLDALIGGWQTSATFMAQTGNPLMITTGNNNSSNNQSGGYTQFPNLVGNYNFGGGRSRAEKLAEWYNLDAFAVPAPFTYGNFRRNIVRGPGLSDVNFALGKAFNIWPEHGVQFQIRADAFNVLNHPSFAQPGNNAIGTGQSAQITGTTIGGRKMELYGRISF